MERWLIVAGLLTLFCMAGQAFADPAIGKLRCEYLTDPAGIDETHPRLSWIMTLPERGQRQTAYRVLVASSAQKLGADTGDLWDSGKIASDESLHVEYAGKQLTSSMACFWKVKVWDKDGKDLGWSVPGQWTMGLLNADDWKGKWIGGQENTQTPDELPVKGAQWIWTPEGDPAKEAPVGTRYFRRTLALPADARVASALCQMTADNSFVLYVNGRQAGAGSDFKTLSQIDIAPLLHAGENVLAVAATNGGDAPNPAGLIAAVEVRLEKAEPIHLVTDGQWKAAADKAAGWDAAGFDDAKWQQAKALGAMGIPPWGKVGATDNRPLPGRMLRKEFSLDKPIARATAYVCGLGLFELHLNGAKVGDHVLEPGLTDYDKRCLYVTFDVTRQLKEGKNAIGVLLGNGRYYAPRRKEPTATRTFGYPKLLMQVELEFADGTRTTVATDETWKLTTDGPIRANNEYDGELYDARQDMPGWDKAGFNDAAWHAAELVSAPNGVLSAQMIEPIRVVETRTPVSVKELSRGTYVFDMGQNMVGWCRLKVRGAAGTTVRLRHAETLQADGSLYLANLRGAQATDTYTLKGAGAEIYVPRFTYHGFRYVEVTGYPGVPALEALEGCVVNDDLGRAGEFACSNPLVNQIAKNIFWGVRGNYRSVPTDCPQRDERQGWLGDRAAEALGESYLFDLSKLYPKWMQDIRDNQRPNGSLGDVVPAYWPMYTNNITWPSLSVIVPGMLYEQYGDRRVVERNYDMMKKWVDRMALTARNGITEADNYGDWCVPPEEPHLIHSRDPARMTAKGVLATSYLYHDLTLMQRYAEILGKKDDAADFAAQAEKTKAAFNAKFFDAAKGQYSNGSQTSYVLPLAFGLVPQDQGARLAARLVEKITKEEKGHVGTGLIGCQWINRVLTQYGYADTAYAMATAKGYPGFSYMIDHGATTIWELWNGNTADPAMNSGNHVMLVGDLYVWLNQNVAGIQADPQRPGFKHVLIKPTPVGDLTSAQATYESGYGRIASRWEKKDGVFTLHVTIPANTTASVTILGANAAPLEDGKPVKATTGIRSITPVAGGVVCEIDSGSFTFTSHP